MNPVRWYNSSPISLANSHGHVLLLDFWATYCGPCVHEQPTIAELARQFSTQGFSVILVHARNTHRVTGTPGGAATIKEIPAEEVLPSFITTHHLTLPVAIASEKNFVQYGVEAIPRYFLVDKKGKIRYDGLEKDAE